MDDEWVIWEIEKKFANSYSLITPKHSVFKGISYNEVVQGKKFIGVSAYI